MHIHHKMSPLCLPCHRTLALTRVHEPRVVCRLLAHGDVVASVRRQRLSSLTATVEDPSCDHQPMVCGSLSSSPHTGAWFLLHPVRPFCLTPSASSTAFYRTDIHRPPGVALPSCRTARAHRPRHTSLPYCLNYMYHPPLTLRHKYNCQVTVI